MRLDKRQLQFFDTFGFLKIPGLFADDVGSIINHFEQVWADHGGGHDGRPHELDKRSCIVRFIDQNEDLCTLLDDRRIVGIATSLMGNDFNYVASEWQLLRRRYPMALGRLAWSRLSEREDGILSGNPDPRNRRPASHSR